MIDNNKKKQDPMTLNYMRYTRLMLLSVGSWPSGISEERPWRVSYHALFLIVYAIILITGELKFIRSRFQVLSFFVLGDVYIALSLSFLVLLRAGISCLRTYGIISKEFITKFHLMHFRHKDEYWQMMYEKVNKVSYYFTSFMIGLSISGVVSFNITPLYRNYQLGMFSDNPPENVSLEFSVHYLYFGIEQDDYYLVSTIANVFISYICAFIICTMDLLLCLMIFQIIGHIQTLVYSLRQFPRPQTKHTVRAGPDGNAITPVTCEIYDDQENEVIRKCINDCVDHHRLIVTFTDDVSSFFGPMLAFNYLYHMFSFSLLLVECMQGQAALMRYGPLTMMTLAQLTQLSVTFEIVGSESEKLKDEVYYLPWESMNVSNQKVVMFFLKRVQTPIRVTAMGMTAVGVQTMGGILKTTFSYCAFLQSLS